MSRLDPYSCDDLQFFECTRLLRNDSCIQIHTHVRGLMAREDELQAGYTNKPVLRTEVLKVCLVQSRCAVTKR
jgi:hypothetical protein